MGKLLNEKQVKQLEEKDWTVVPKGAYVNLYPDDFESDDSWEQICDQVNLPYDVDQIQILYIGVNS